MKILKTLLLAALFISFATSCENVNVDLDINSITIHVKGDFANHYVSEGDVLNVAIKARDGDGIESIRIEIPILDVDLLIEDNIGANKWKINRNFDVDTIDDPGRHNIIITVTDLVGEEYREIERFRFK